MMKSIFLAVLGGVAATMVPTMASAQTLLVVCTMAGGDVEAVSPLFTLKDDALGTASSGQAIQDVRAYGEKFKDVMAIAGFGGNNLPHQFYDYSLERLNNGGSCVAATDRELMLAYYARLKERGYSKQLLNDWRPTEGAVMKVEEWRN